MTTSLHASLVTASPPPLGKRPPSKLKLKQQTRAALPHDGALAPVRFAAAPAPALPPPPAPAPKPADFFRLKKQQQILVEQQQQVERQQQIEQQRLRRQQEQDRVKQLEQQLVPPPASVVVDLPKLPHGHPRGQAPPRSPAAPPPPARRTAVTRPPPAPAGLRTAHAGKPMIGRVDGAVRFTD